ncbi:MAG: Gfo/Idh/MocA family oxidoreductase [Prolixibacteraceae bacterium]|nr:Gfo/Idh/MocA family oxidoreductase [Prolixibacteraceae bacterium]
MKKVRWGILSTAKIGTVKIIPAIQKASNCEVLAISSRTFDNAKKEADKLGIPKAYGSYEAMLSDPEIDAVYNPLPNHLHVPYTLKALEAGKHVLCEKPISLNSEEAARFLAEVEKFPDLKVMEAFMYRFHPQWQKAKQLVHEGAIGEVKTIHSFFSYYKTDPENIRNMFEIGGGGLMDIGCYCISFPRFIFEKEPKRAVGLIDRDPDMKIDRLSSGMLDFSDGLTSTFTCSTQLMAFQQAEIHGTKGRIEIEIPVNAPPDEESRICLYTEKGKETITFPPVDQYTLQAEQFANAIINNKPVPIPLTDALCNMKVIDALFNSAEKNKWISL